MLPDRPYPCACVIKPNVIIGSAWSADQCRLCWLYEHDSRYRARWGDKTKVKKTSRKRGRRIRRKRCNVCDKKTNVKGA